METSGLCGVLLVSSASGAATTPPQLRSLQICGSPASALTRGVHTVVLYPKELDVVRASDGLDAPASANARSVQAGVVLAHGTPRW